MDHSRKDMAGTRPAADTESMFINSDEDSESMIFGGLFSQHFSNIAPVYSSPNGATEIYSAMRYGKRFILKGLKELYRNDPVYAIALAKEFEIGMMLEHPGIRRTLGLESVGNIGQVIVLEYVDGSPLDAVIASGRLTVAAARSIAAQLAAALRYMHGKQVLHRDLKPSNILISHHGNTVKIIDFNLSDSDDFVVLKKPAGSKKYMAPEQLLPDAKPSVAADIYSLGAVMGELAAATGDSRLAGVAERCMNPDPEKRPQSVERISLPDAQPSAADTLQRVLESKALTYIASGICLALAAAIAFAL